MKILIATFLLFLGSFGQAKELLKLDAAARMTDVELLWKSLVFYTEEGIISSQVSARNNCTYSLKYTRTAQIGWSREMRLTLISAKGELLYDLSIVHPDNISFILTHHNTGLTWKSDSFEEIEFGPAGVGWSFAVRHMDYLLFDTDLGKDRFWAKSTLALDSGALENKTSVGTLISIGVDTPHVFRVSLLSTDSSKVHETRIATKCAWKTSDGNAGTWQR